ncbi:MAG: transposase [Pseudomonadota bacterium]
MQDTIGVDVSKDTLDARRLSDEAHIQVSNDREGLLELITWMKGHEIAQVVYEATGRYHRTLERILGKHGFPLAKVNPKNARRFAEAVGRLAKTDRVDALMLARMGRALDLERHPAPPEKHLFSEIWQELGAP